MAHLTYSSTYPQVPPPDKYFNAIPQPKQKRTDGSPNPPKLGPQQLDDETNPKYSPLPIDNDASRHFFRGAHGKLHTFEAFNDQYVHPDRRDRTRFVVRDFFWEQRVHYLRVGDYNVQEFAEADVW